MAASHSPSRFPRASFAQVKHVLSSEAHASPEAAPSQRLAADHSTGTRRGFQDHRAAHVCNPLGSMSGLTRVPLLTAGWTERSGVPPFLGHLDFEAVQDRCLTLQRFCAASVSGVS